MDLGISELLPLACFSLDQGRWTATNPQPRATRYWIFTFDSAHSFPGNLVCSSAAYLGKVLEWRNCISPRRGYWFCLTSPQRETLSCKMLSWLVGSASTLFSSILHVSSHITTVMRQPTFQRHQHAISRFDVSEQPLSWRSRLAPSGQRLPSQSAGNRRFNVVRLARVRLTAQHL